MTIRFQTVIGMAWLSSLRSHSTPRCTTKCIRRSLSSESSSSPGSSAHAIVSRIRCADPFDLVREDDDEIDALIKFPVVVCVQGYDSSPDS